MPFIFIFNGIGNYGFTLSLKVLSVTLTAKLSLVKTSGNSASKVITICLFKTGDAVIGSILEIK
jgi:hypothetical protein